MNLQTRNVSPGNVAHNLSRSHSSTCGKKPSSDTEFDHSPSCEKHDTEQAMERLNQVAKRMSDLPDSMLPGNRNCCPVTPQCEKSGSFSRPTSADLKQLAALIQTILDARAEQDSAVDMFFNDVMAQTLADVTDSDAPAVTKPLPEATTETPVVKPLLESATVTVVVKPLPETTTETDVVKPLPVAESETEIVVEPVAPTEVELADPDRAPDEAGVHNEVEGELFVGAANDEIQITDVNQRGLANCYFLAAVAAVAVTNPDAIRDMITDNGNGTYTVHFGGELGDVTVDDDLLMTGSSLVGATVENGSGGPELWVAIIEKAYAQGRGSYEATEWDAMQTGLDDLLGEGTTSVQDATAFTSADMNAAIASGSPMIANTYGDSAPYADNGLSNSHVYAITGYARDDAGNIRIGSDGQPMIELYNPWGHTEFGSDSNNDGLFAMTWTEFQEKFNTVGTGEAV